MADFRLQSKTGVTELTINLTDILYLDSASGGTVRKLPVSELIKVIRGGDVTAGTAKASAVLLLDIDKKISEVGGIEMSSAYTPTNDQDVVTKTYLEETILDEGSPVICQRVDFAHTDLPSGTKTTVLTMPAGAIIQQISVNIKTAFTGTGTDLIDIGITSDDDYFEADIDASATGIVTCDDATMPYKTAAEDVVITYTDQNGDADAGGVEVYIWYALFD